MNTHHGSSFASTNKSAAQTHQPVPPLNLLQASNRESRATSSDAVAGLPVRIYARFACARSAVVDKPEQWMEWKHAQALEPYIDHGLYEKHNASGRSRQRSRASPKGFRGRLGAEHPASASGYSIRPQRASQATQVQTG